MGQYLTKKIYIAGPLFNTHEKGYLEKISIELESNDYECFLPHRDQKGVTEEELEQLDMSEATKEKIFKNDLNALKNSDITVALLTGQDIDLERRPKLALVMQIKTNSCDYCFRKTFSEFVCGRNDRQDNRRNRHTCRYD